MSAAEAAEVRDAKVEAERARKQLLTTLGALQYRLKPGTLAGEAWEGVKDKGTGFADGAVQTVKERPVAASGAIAAAVLFLARRPIRSAASRLFRGKQDDDLVTTRLVEDDDNYDITAPVAPTATSNEGAKA